MKYAKGTPQDLVIVCDTLDLPPGSCRLKTKGTSTGHRGLESVIRYLGTNEFVRLYIGIGRPSSKNEVIAHVLGEPSPHEQILINRAFERAEVGLLDLLEKTPEQVMNVLNETEE
jgi:PTH1 family peptidyl-tRNA hydrolase